MKVYPILTKAAYAYSRAMEIVAGFSRPGCKGWQMAYMDIESGV